jgi:flagellar assembly protein FliH
MSATKFTFDTEFRTEGDLVSQDARARQKRSYSHDEIEAMCAHARTEGTKSAQVRAQEIIAAGALEAVTILRSLLEDTHRDIEIVRAEATAVAMIAAKKLARAALAVRPESDVEAALREAMHQAIGEPRILLRTAPGIADAINARLSEIAHEEGYEGRVQVSGDPAFKSTDCRIEWRGGGAERNETAIEAALNEIITRRFEGAARN